MTPTHQFIGDVTAAPLLAVLHKECFEPAWDENTFYDLLTLPGTLAQILCTEEIPTGFILYQIIDIEAEILTLGVLPSARGRSIGFALMQNGFRHMEILGVQRLFLEVSETNIAAKDLYEKAGFSRVGVRKGYYREKDGRTDALILEKQLG